MSYSYTTTYSYDDCCGVLTNIDYSGATPDIAFTYDRLGRQRQVTDAQGARTFSYDPATLALTNETLVAGGVTSVIARTYDNYGRSSGVTLGDTYATGYAYDAFGRFNQVDWTFGGSSRTATYAYVAGADLVGGYDLPSGTNTFSTRRAYEDTRNLITAVSNLWGSATVSAFDYQNDALGRRTRRIDTLAVTNVFDYNACSELTSALMDTNSYHYAYDPIGNRRSTTNNAETLSYLANELNQYTNIANGVTNTPTYDADGNLLTYGGWTFTWNGENRLVKTESLASVPDAAKVKVENLYDYMGRRVRKTVSSDYSGGSYTTTNVTTYVWDGFNIIAEMCDAGYTNWYTYGLDLSGTLQGAGGVGGAFAMTRDTGTATNTYLYCFDGNGNVVNLVDAGDGSIAATYEYSPFGALIRSTGDMADDNPVRWSTKHTDDETGLVMYEFRPYSPELGRFISRDLIEESGGLNLYVVVLNAPISATDPFGLVSLPQFIEMFILYLSGRGSADFGGYSESVWKGILEHSSVRLYEISVTSKAEACNKCCTEYSKTLPGKQLVKKSSFFNMTLSSLHAGVVIGSGSLWVDDTTLEVVCNAEKCAWSANIEYTVEDKYSFRKFDDQGHELPWWHMDNNWILRVFLGLDLWGHDFDASDTRRVVKTGIHPCRE